MKKKELTTLRAKSTLELKKEVKEKKSELSALYAKTKAGREKNLKKVKNLGHDIAQILTIIREKELLEQSAHNKGQRKIQEKEVSERTNLFRARSMNSG